MILKVTFNMKISIIALVAIIIPFVLLGMEYNIDLKLQENKNTIDQLTKKDFFSNNFPEPRTMFLLGSSQVQFINITKVNNLITNDDILIYNLAITSDVPVDRIEHLEKIISINPEIIFYGISYRDFQIPYPDDELPSIKQINLCLFSSHFPSNPKLITIELIKKITPEEILIPKKKSRLIENTPFVDYFTNISAPISLEPNEKLLDVIQSWNNICILEQNMSALNTMISEFQNNDIEVVIFTTPLSKFFLDSLSDSQKERFDKLLKNLTKKYGVKIYEFEERYSELNMWSDHQHISIHDSVTNYNEDIASMIIKESES